MSWVQVIRSEVPPFVRDRINRPEPSFRLEVVFEDLRIEDRLNEVVEQHKDSLANARRD